jgi:Nif-specific regulatory protein
VVSATNRPLNQLVMTNQFRYDLLFRLRSSHRHSAAARARRRPRLLADYWLAASARQYGVASGFSAASMRVLERCQWPGNVRQLIGSSRPPTRDGRFLHHRA